MKLSSEVVEKICGMDHLSGKERTEVLVECERIASVVATIENRIREAEEDHEANMRELASDIELARSKCSHRFSNRHADPSGGSDSFSECQVCGKQF